MLHHEGARRTPTENLVLAFVLAGVAGAVNAVGWLELGVFTSHLSGHVTRVALEGARNDDARSLFFLWLVVAYIAGAMTATLFVERARLLGRARNAATLLIEAALLTGVTVVSQLVPDGRYAWLPELLRWVLCFSMGLQNALITKLSGAVVRTTHLTGMLTDLSIEAVRLGFWAREHFRSRGRPQLGDLRALPKIAGHKELGKARLHITILFSFGSSAAVGTWLFLNHGRIAMSLPIAALVGLVALDLVLTRRRGEVSEPPAPKSSAG